MPANFGSNTGRSMFRRSLLAGASAVALGLLLVPVGTVSQAQGQEVCELVSGGGGGANASGTNSFACGPDANADGLGATAVGNDANAVGTFTTAVGSSAGGGTSGTGNSFFGHSAGANTDGDNNTATGRSAGRDVDGDFNTAIGYFAGTLVVGDSNTAIGDSAGQIVYGNNNFAAGLNAGNNIGDEDTETEANDNIAIGTNAGSDHLFSDTIALGRDTVVGDDEAIAIGHGAISDSIAIGVFSSAVGNAENTAIGNFASADGTGVFGNTALGWGADASGAGGAVDGGANVATGALANASGNQSANVASGLSANASGAGSANVAIGRFANASGSGTANIAIGVGATASNNSTAIGEGSQAVAANSTAMGRGTWVQEAGGVAIGTDSLGDGAISTEPNQFVMGTVEHTYTAPGITSDLSRTRQDETTRQLVTSDADGNLATDDGLLFASLDEHAFQLERHDRRLNEHTSGIALAMSMQNPDLVGAERFGIAGSWGTFEGAHALSVSVMGVVGYDVFSPGDRIAVSGGFGAGFGHKSGRSVYGGRAGVQWTW